MSRCLVCEYSVKRVGQNGTSRLALGIAAGPSGGDVPYTAVLAAAVEQYWGEEDMLVDHTPAVLVDRRCRGRDLGVGLAGRVDCGCARCGPGLYYGREDRGFYPTTPATCCFSL